MSLHISSKWVCRNCRDGLRQQQSIFTRQFSKTRPVQKAAIPKFTPTSSPELDTLLATIRSKVFVPSYLNKSQLKLVRSQKAKTQLENDPVYATFGEEEIRLTPLDVTKDQPKTKVLLEFKDMAKDSKGWANLPPLLEGWHHARPRIPTKVLSKLLKEASKAGQLQTIIQCLWQVEKNGLSLADAEVRFIIIHSIRSHAMKVDFLKAPNTGLKQIQTVLELMEKPEHCGSRTVSDLDPRAQPHAIGVALELAAQKAKNEFGGKDEDGLVATYFNRLISVLGQQKSELSNFSLQQIQKKNGLKRFMQLYVPVWHALKLATEILGESVSTESRATAEKYKKDIGMKLNLTYKAVQASSAKPESPIGVLAEWKNLREQ